MFLFLISLGNYIYYHLVNPPPPTESHPQVLHPGPANCLDESNHYPGIRGGGGIVLVNVLNAVVYHVHISAHPQVLRSCHLHLHRTAQILQKSSLWHVPPQTALAALKECMQLVEAYQDAYKGSRVGMAGIKKTESLNILDKYRYLNRLFRTEVKSSFKGCELRLFGSWLLLLRQYASSKFPSLPLNAEVPGLGFVLLLSALVFSQQSWFWAFLFFIFFNFTPLPPRSECTVRKSGHSTYPKVDFSWNSSPYRTVSWSFSLVLPPCLLGVMIVARFITPPPPPKFFIEIFFFFPRFLNFSI